jgi:hypothetical protein
MKIFSLPKTATQSPRNMPLAGSGESRRHRSRDGVERLNDENGCSTGAFLMLTIAAVAISGAARIAAGIHCRVLAKRAPRALTPARQHFLKLEAVFSSVLVYSGWSASRFPSARSDQVISKLGGQHGQES